MSWRERKIKSRKKIKYQIEEATNTNHKRKK